jgi:hypothetical protein
MSEDSDNLSLDEIADQAEEASEEPSSKDADRIVLAHESSDGKWNLIQEYLIEIHADARLKEGTDSTGKPGQRFPTLREQRELLKRKIEEEYSHDQKLRTSLINCIPSRMSMSRWTRLDGWDDAVVAKMKSFGIFTPTARGEVMKSIHKKAVDGDMIAAKLYVSMSGDFVEKGQAGDEKFEVWKKYIDSMNRKKTGK